MRITILMGVLLSVLLGCPEDVLVVQEGAAIDVNTLQLDFGGVNIGERSELRVLITNIGEQPLIIEELSMQSATDQFGSVTQAPLEIPRNQSEELTLFFFPVAAELYLGGIDIKSNAENLPTIRLELKGQGRDWSVCADCDNPPPPDCVTDRHRLVYDEQGSCEGDNQCRFAVSIETCAELCLNGVCIGGLEGADGGTLCGPSDPDSDGDGVCDSDDNCKQVSNPNQEDADEDNRGDICDICEGFDDFVDTDEDGVPNGCDICTTGDDTIDSDDDGVPDACDRCDGHLDSLDQDEDGVPDGCDVCAAGSDALDTDNDGVPNDCDLCDGHDDNVDDDNDNIPNGCDVCPSGDDGLDTDNDGVPNACDSCANGTDEEDDDNDGVPNDCDVCPGYSDNLDADGDSVPDACDICSEGSDFIDNDNDDVPDACDICLGANNNYDDDSDGVPNGCDLCPEGPDHVDTDEDGVPNACDVCPALASTDQSDSDLDGVGDLCDNCPQVSNPTQENSDADQWGDVCDLCPTVVHPNDQVDDDGDGVGNVCDVCDGFDDNINTDGDVYPDGCDLCPLEPSYDNTDTDGDGVGDICEDCPGSDDTIDMDGDNIPDCIDDCDQGPNELDADADGVPDDCDICPAGPDDLDEDGDTVPDACDRCDFGDDRLNADLDYLPDACDPCPAFADESDTDADGDGIPDDCDLCPDLPNGPGTDVVVYDQNNDGIDECVEATCVDGMNNTWPVLDYPFTSTPDRFERFANCESTGECAPGAVCTEGRCIFEAVVEPDAGSHSADQSQWVVRDHETGLLWQGCMLGEHGANCMAGERLLASHADLAASCTDLNLQNWGGYASGWRMPTIQEVLSLVDYSHTTPFMSLEQFPNHEGRVFSSTSKANQRETYAYMLHVEDNGTIYSPGTVVPEAKQSIDIGTRCVNGFLNQKRCFVNEGLGGGDAADAGSPVVDRSVTDHEMQLEWQEGFWGWTPTGGWEYNAVGLGNYVGSRDDYFQCDNGNPCCNMFDGKTDWRQPTIGELMSLIHTGLPQTGPPNWPQEIFGTPEGVGSTLFFWSKSRYPNSLSRRWGVDFYSNVDLLIWRENNGVFKCVRDL